MKVLYFISLMGNLKAFLIFAIVILTISTAFFLSDDYEYKNSYKYKKDTEDKKLISPYISKAKKTGVALLATSIIYTLIPSKRDMYIIFGIGSIIDYAKNNEEVNKLPDNTIRLLNTALENLNNELRDKRKKEETK